MPVCKNNLAYILLHIVPPLKRYNLHLRAYSVLYMRSLCQGVEFLLGFLLAQFLVLRAVIGFPVSSECTKKSVFCGLGELVGSTLL